MLNKMTKTQSASLGGLENIRKNGNPGTAAGRQKGGQNSIKIHNKNAGNFVTKKVINLPEGNSEVLAELMGILFGDGHLAKYQVSITTNRETDLEHATYIQQIFHTLFQVKAPIRSKKDANAVEIVVSSIELVEWLHLKGMPKGNKMKSDLSIPNWVKENSGYSQKFIRGLFDTDGCIYTDKHRIRGVEYRNLGWTITSYSDKLRSDLVLLLQKLGYHPTCSRKQVRLYLRRKNEIDRYFKEIATSNVKHLRRYGSVAEWLKAPFSKNGVGETRS